MADFYKGTIPIINDDPKSMQLAFPDGEDNEESAYGRGYVPRDYNEYPEEMFQHPNEMNLYDESEWDALYDEQEKNQSSIEHLYLRGGKPAFLNLDQNGQGFCWMYSSVHSIMLTRLINNQPLVRLSAHATACKLQNFQNRGGWCGQSAEGLRQFGVPSVEYWPEKSMSRQYDNAETWENAKLHRITEDWVDLTRPVHSQTMAKKSLATALFNNCPSPTDYAWWGHSVCAVRWVRIERGSWGPLILNSWAGWGRYGLGVLQGSKANFMGAVSTRVVGAAVK
jgi:hypothetical protein